MGKNKKSDKTEEKKETFQIFVSGIPYECSDEEFKTFFADIQDNIVEIKLPRYQDSGRCIGYAHITVNTTEAQQLALAKSGQHLKGRYLEVKEAQGQKQYLSKDQLQTVADSMPDDCKTIFVKGLPYEFKEDDVGDRFRKYGEIKSVRLAYNWKTKQSKGFAYIQYYKHESAKKALVEMNNKEIQGRKLKIDFDVVEEPKKGYKVNLNKEKNKFYNKEVLKEETQKRKKKETEKKKLSQIKVQKMTS